MYRDPPQSGYTQTGQLPDGDGHPRPTMHRNINLISMTGTEVLSLAAILLGVAIYCFMVYSEHDAEPCIAIIYVVALITIIAGIVEYLKAYLKRLLSVM